MAYIACNLKSMNRKLVFQLLLTGGEMSKAEISRETGISAPTVIKIISYFKSIGYVEELGEGDTALGRKPQLLRINPKANYAIGIEFTGIKIKLGIVDIAGNIGCIETEKAEPDFGKTIGESLPERIDRLLAKSGIPIEKILGICIGLPGRVNKEQKTITLAPLEGITDSTGYGDIIEKLTERYQIPVSIENDANAAAIGEFNFRGLQPDDDLLYVAFGKGIGAGIILNGRLRTGRSFLAGEIGYMVFDKQFTANKQHAGWLEQMTMPELLSEHQQSISDQYIDGFVKNLGMAVVNLCGPLEIHHIILGHMCSERFDNELVNRVNDYLRQISVIDLACSRPQCREPVITGCSNIIINPVLDKIFDE